MISRRALLGGAAAAATVPLVAGCNTVTRSTDITALNQPVTLPTYQRFAGPKPDLPRIDPGIPDAFYHFPADPQSVFRGKPADGEVLQGTAPTSSPIPPTVDRNTYWQELNRRLGSPLRMSITSADDWSDKFASAVAGDTLGDLFNVDGAFAYLPQFLEAKAQDLTEYLSGDAILDYPFLANIPTESWEQCVFAGAIRAVPVPRGPLSSQVLYARQDLFDKLGVEPTFSTVEELIAIAKEVTDQRKNRWAFAVVPQDVLAQMFGLPNGWRSENGRLINRNEHEAQKDMLAVGAKLIKQGLVHPDAVTAPDQKVWFNQGSGLMTQDTYSAMPGFYQQNVAGPSFDVSLPIVPGPDGKPADFWLASPNNSIAAIKPGNEQWTRMLLRVLDWCAAPFGTQEYLFRKFGLEGRHYELKDGDPVPTKIGNSETALGAFPIQYFTDCPMPIYYTGFPQATDTVYNHLKTVIKKSHRSPVNGLYSPTQSTKGPVLDDRVAAAVNDILLGREKVSSWDQVMADWRKGGGDKIRAEYEQAMAVRGRS